MRLRIRAMPRHAHATLSIVTTGHSRSQNGVLRTPMPVVHAEFEQANARWEALCKRKFCMDCRIKSGNDEWNERKRFGGETPTDAIGIQPRLTGPAAPPSGGAHLSAFHRGSGLGDRTPPPSFSSALPGMRPPSGFPLSLPVSVQRCFSRTGRNAGRADFPNCRERVASPRAGTALAPGLRPAGRSPSESSGEVQEHM
jgi:hypothetical protein